MMLGSCCCCFSLKTGTILIAILGLLQHALVFGLGIYALIKGNFPHTQIVNDVYVGPEHIVDYYHDAKLLLPSAIILVSLDTMLLYAAIKGMHKHMLPWLVLQGSILVISVYFLVSFMVAYPGILIGIGGIMLAAYFWAVVFSHYRQLKIASKFDAPHKMDSYGP